MLPAQDVGMPLSFAGMVVASAVTFFRYAAGQGQMCTAGTALLSSQAGCMVWVMCQLCMNTQAGARASWRRT